MHELGTWDDSLVVVTADHGLSFTPGAHLRGASAENVHEVAWTPLLVKTPGQGRGEVVDRPVRSIDVVPTIADVLGMELPEEVDGTSVLDERRRRDDEVRLLDWGPSDLPTDDDGYATLDGEAGYEAVLESPRPAAGDDPDLALHRHGRYGSLVGRRLDDLDVAAPTPWLAEVNPPGARRVVDDPRRQVPVYVVGKLPGGPDVDVAVAANGVVGAVAPVYRPFGPAARIFLTFLPERLLHEGENRLGVYLVEGSQRSPRLREVPTIDLRP
jgi:Sulfatase